MKPERPAPTCLEGTTINVGNKYCVAATKDVIIIADPPGSVMLSPNDALNLAAWLIVKAQHKADATVEQIVSTIRNRDLV